jgi:hypothetical protein
MDVLGSAIQGGYRTAVDLVKDLKDLLNQRQSSA